MQVETYEVKEVSNHPEVTEEVKKLVDELGLKGQIQFLGESDDTEGGVGSVYRRMNREEQFAYGMLMPVRTKPELYRSGPIPVRVLEVLKKCKESGFFKEFEIWHPEDATVDDPILVGLTKSDKGYGNTLWLLARWGECLIPFQNMLKQASFRWRARTISQINSAISRAQQDKQRLESADPETAYMNLNEYADAESTPNFSSILRA